MKSDKTKQKESLEQEVNKRDINTIIWTISLQIKSLRQAVSVATTDLNPAPDFQDTQQHKLQKKGYLKNVIESTKKQFFCFIV